MTEAHRRSSGSATAPAGAATRPSASSAGTRRASAARRVYEDVTIDTQPSMHRHLRPRAGRSHFEDGRGTWDDDSTALRVERLVRVPRPRPAVGAALLPERAPPSSTRSRARCAPPRRGRLRRLHARVGRVPAQLPAGAGVRRARAVVRDGDRGARLPVGLDHGVRGAAGGDEAALGAGASCSTGWTSRSTSASSRSSRRASAGSTDEPWQPTRRYLERLRATADWGELIVAANLCFEPLFGTAVRRELRHPRRRGQRRHRDPGARPGREAEWEWVRDWTAEFLRFVLDDEEHGGAPTASGSPAGWDDWLPLRRGSAALGLAAGRSSELPARRSACDEAARRACRSTCDDAAEADCGAGAEPAPARGSRRLSGRGRPTTTSGS